MTLPTLPLNNLQTYYHPLTSPNMFLSLLTYIIIHWTSLSLLFILISSQQYHSLLLLYLITCMFSLTSTLHPDLLHSLVKLSAVASKTLIPSNSITTSLHPIKFCNILHHYLNCLIATIPHFAQF